MSDEAVLTIAQVAQRLHIHENVVYELVKTKRIPHVRLGAQRTRFYWPAVAQWLTDEGQRSIGKDAPVLGLVADRSPPG